MARDKHARNKLILKIVGLLLLAVGLTLIIWGFVDFFSSFGDGSPSKFCMFAPGFPCMGIGLALTMIGFKREITGYMKNEAMPVINEASQELRPAVRAVAGAAMEGFRPGTKCTACGADNPKDNKFCSECGAPLTQACPACGAKLEGDDRFCGNCGAPLQDSE